ncbi:unnamed protein product [Ilex paraguariensis]|uniref:Uncharacterized protein n=1 Tax=Ilex paraguariensis TaxID=185542 RepID=A0ABC8RXJ3_9AQUA
MHKEVPSRKPTKITSSLATEASPEVNPCPSTTLNLVYESSIRRKEGVAHALSNEVRQESLFTTKNVPLEQHPRGAGRLKQATSWSQGEILVLTGNVEIKASPILKAPINIETSNKFSSLVVELTGIKENDMEKLVSPKKSLLSSKVRNIDGVPFGTTRKKKQKQKYSNQGKVGVPKAQEREDLHSIVSNVWQAQIRGTIQFQVNQKLKLLKAEFKKINKEKVVVVTIKAIEANEQLSACQRRLDTNSHDQSLRILEKELVGKCFEAFKIEEDFLRQKFRLQWLAAGDKNSSFYFKSI